MAELSLYLTDAEQPQLHRTHFSHSLLEDEQRCVRGKSEGAYSGYASFQWTAGVKALVIFFLRSRCASAQDSERVVLEGEDGSLASSLDYALGKLPLWPGAC